MFKWYFDWKARTRPTARERWKLGMDPAKGRDYSSTNFFYNGKRITEDDPEWEEANRQLKAGMDTLDKSMKNMDELFKKIF